MRLVIAPVVFVAWFAGLRHLTAGAVGLAGEAFGTRQVVGMALVLVGVLVGQKWRATTLARRSQRPRP